MCLFFFFFKNIFSVSPYIMKAVVVKVLFLRETNIDSSAEEEICGFNIVKQGRVSSAFLIQVPMQKNCKSRSITPLLDNMG